MKLRKARMLFAGLALLLAPTIFSLALALDVPPLRGRINDYAGLIPADRAQALEERLARFEAETGHQIAVLTIPSLKDDSLEDFSIRVAEAWKIGKKGFDNGAILLIAGEMLPRTLVLQRREAWVAATAPLLRVYCILMSPLAMPLIRFLHGIARLFGRAERIPYLTAEQLIAVVEAEHRGVLGLDQAGACGAPGAYCGSGAKPVPVVRGSPGGGAGERAWRAGGQERRAAR